MILLVAALLLSRLVVTTPRPPRPAPPPPPSEVIAVMVKSDDDVPLPHAGVLLDGRRVMETDAEGLARVRLYGEPGDTFALSPACPDGFDAPPKPVTVPFVILSSSGRPPEHALRCTARKRRVVVAVRAENGANLPVMHLGREIGRTDASGAAHVVLDVRAKEPNHLSLGTATFTFVAPEHDDLVVFDAHLPKPRKIAVVKKSAPPATEPKRL